MPRKPIITLTTDFDTNDHFVGTMKGVIYNINPDVEIVDITHKVASYDIFDAAFTLAQSYRYFPFGYHSPGGGRSRSGNDAPAYYWRAASLTNSSRPITACSR